MIAIICVELEYLFQNTKMYFWFYLWPLYHYIIYIKQIISSCTLPGTWMAKSFYILCTLKCCTCKITPNSSLWQSYPWFSRLHFYISLTFVNVYSSIFHSILRVATSSIHKVALYLENYVMYDYTFNKYVIARNNI